MDVREGGEGAGEFREEVSEECWDEDEAGAEDSGGDLCKCP